MEQSVCICIWYPTFIVPINTKGFAMLHYEYIMLDMLLWSHVERLHCHATRLIYGQLPISSILVYDIYSLSLGHP